MEAEAVIETALRAGRSHYAALGLSPSATEEQIRKEYIRRSRLIHPDKCAHPKAKEAFQIISHAYRTLSESSSRSRYDSTGDSPPRTGAEETLSRLLDAILSDFMEGRFDNVVMIAELFTSLPGFGIAIDRAAMRSSLHDLHRGVTLLNQYRSLLQVDLLRLAEIHTTWRSLPPLDLLGQSRVAVSLVQTVVSLLARIDDPEVELLRGRLRAVVEPMTRALAGVNEMMARPAVDQFFEGVSVTNPATWLVLVYRVVVLVWTVAAICLRAARGYFRE